jgi:ribosomal protein S18 acetylase RimI-like enzyme
MKEIRYAEGLIGVDWAALKAQLAADEFDNGRTPNELQGSFSQSHSAVIAWHGDRVVATARLLADGVCNAYLVDVWTDSHYRRRGIGSEMVRRLLHRVPGHHVGLFTDGRVDFYRSLGFEEEATGMSCVVGRWLNREEVPRPRGSA